MIDPLLMRHIPTLRIHHHIQDLNGFSLSLERVWQLPTRFILDGQIVKFDVLKQEFQFQQGPLFMSMIYITPLLTRRDFETTGDIHHQSSSMARSSKLSISF